MRTRWRAGALALLLVSGLAQALTLDEARRQGLAGETLGGWLAVRVPGMAVERLVAEINAGRHAEYERIAADNHLTREAVARIAGQKLVARAPAGEYVQGINGLWRQKRAAQSGADGAAP
ncbi:YdbL family protein [Pantoea sp. 1.19]|uniref:YdbL family protein n=1 Tax=Pantoea sp. 1.19 TaxID=1925589 RepID=UPI000948AF22|nr:DUF1318 domain-containing protein [Pantoea sp. 1.19]